MPDSSRMVRKSLMILAGETSGDMLAAQLVRALRSRLNQQAPEPTEDLQPLQSTFEPEFFGAGGPHLAEAGVSLEVDMTQHAVVGLWEVIKNYSHFRRIFHQLLAAAIEHEPDAVICVDFSGFNLRFAHAIRQHCRSLQGTFGNWQPLLIQYVSPQVWASRPERARALSKDFDLLLSILPFEKEWYARRVPNLDVEFVGHPLVDRYAAIERFSSSHRPTSSASPTVLLLPGSRVGEIRRHLPVLIETFSRIRSRLPAARGRLVLPNEALAQLARTCSLPLELQLQIGNIAEALLRADLAIASTGTVTLECAYFGVPTVALYKTSRLTYWIAKQLVEVEFLAMPNLLANDLVFPEFVQDAANADNLSRAAFDLLEHPERRDSLRHRLRTLAQSLGEAGASDRAARRIVQLLNSAHKPLRAALRA